MTKIISIAGAKRSGKGSAANYIMGTILWQNQLIKGTYKINDKGELWVSDLYGDERMSGIFDTSIDDPYFQKFLNEEVYPKIRIYNFADYLKQICMDLFGLSFNQCYGSEEDKTSLSKVKWSNFPGKRPSKTNLTAGFIHEPFMTAREVLQYVGTEIFRRMNDTCWIDATFAKIKRDNPEVAVIADLRFPNEAKATKDQGGYLLKTTRCDITDDHESENAMKDWTDYDFVIDNKDLSIPETNKLVDNIMKQIGI